MFILWGWLFVWPHVLQVHPCVNIFSQAVCPCMYTLRFHPSVCLLWSVGWHLLLAVVNSAALSIGRWRVLSPCSHFLWVCVLRWDYCVRHHLPLWLSSPYFLWRDLLKPPLKHIVRSQSEKCPVQLWQKS